MNTFQNSDLKKTLRPVAKSNLSLRQRFFVPKCGRGKYSRRSVERVILPHPPLNEPCKRSIALTSSLSHINLPHFGTNELQYAILTALFPLPPSTPCSAKLFRSFPRRQPGGNFEAQTFPSICFQAGQKSGAEVFLDKAAGAHP